MPSTTLDPEDPDTVRGRDLTNGGRQYVGASRGKHGTTGDSPPARRRHKNPADRPRSTATRRRSARQDAKVAGYAGPPEAGEVLANGQQYGHRFTDTQWMILSFAYGPDKRSDRWIEKNTDLGDARNIRQARLAAERICFELVREYKPTRTKQQRIQNDNPYNEELTLEERALLNRHRPDRPKKGRKLVSGWSPSPEIPRGSAPGRTGAPRTAQAEWDGHEPRRDVDKAPSSEPDSGSAGGLTFVTEQDDWEEGRSEVAS